MADELTLNQRIGLKLRDLREDKKLSLRDFEIISKINHRTLWEYEKGNIAITVDKLQVILDVYGMSVGKFLDDIRNYQPEPSLLDKANK